MRRLDRASNLFGVTEYAGTSRDGTAFELSPIPEPATLSLLALGGLAILRRTTGHGG
jgi:hypothetical protein